MRRSLVLAIAAVVTASAFGCEPGTGSSSNQRTPRRNTSATQDDSLEENEGEHDANDRPGETATDPGNPNADATPIAPTSLGTSSGEFGITLGSTTPTVNLGESVDVNVTIEPKSGFTGNVALSVSGLSDGVTAVPVTANVTSGPAIARLTLTAAVTALVTAPNESVPLVITATSGDAQATANASFKVAPKVKLTIPVNVDALRGASQLRSEYGEAFGPQAEPLTTQPGNGIVVTIFNADSKAHIIHGPGGAFPHGNTGAPIQPNAFEMNNGAVRTRTLGTGTNVTAYLHDGQQGQGASFRIRVQAPAE